MLLKRAFSPLILLPFLLGAAQAQPESAKQPDVIQALKAQGVEIMQEFDAGEHVRAFVGLAGGEPVAVYVLPDGTAVAGTRLNAKGEMVDEQTLQELVAKPMGDQEWAALESSTWVRDGSEKAPRVVYTFTDANCPYCHMFWEAARPWVDSGKVQLRHVLVGVIKPDSPAKAAAILNAPDPSVALTENETKFDEGGITPAQNVSDEMQQTLEDHQLLMLSLGFRGTPGIVVRDADGALQKHNGMPQGDVLTELLGPL